MKKLKLFTKIQTVISEHHTQALNEFKMRAKFTEKIKIYYFLVFMSSQAFFIDTGNVPSCSGGYLKYLKLISKILITGIPIVNIPYKDKITRRGYF